MITFNADEIYETAEQIERNGAAFYRKAAEQADGQRRDILLTLAEMEEEHEKTFADMRAELADGEKRTVTADPDNEGALYLQALADGRVFVTDPAKAFAGEDEDGDKDKKSLRDILQTAVSLEKDSIVFYQSMKAVVAKAAGRDRLMEIIEQEIGHILILSRQIESLGK